MYSNHVNENGGRCKRGFLQHIIDTANEKANGLGITRDGINNEMISPVFRVLWKE